MTTTLAAAIAVFRAGVRVGMVLADAALVRDNNFRFLRAAVLKVPVVLMCDCGETDRERQHSHSWTIKSIVYGASDITSCPIPQDEVGGLWRHIVQRQHSAAQAKDKSASLKVQQRAMTAPGSGDNLGLLPSAAGTANRGGEASRANSVEGPPPVPLTTVGRCENGVLLRSMITGRYIVNQKLQAGDANTLHKPAALTIDSEGEVAPGSGGAASGKRAATGSKRTVGANSSHTDGTSPWQAALQAIGVQSPPPPQQEGADGDSDVGAAANGDSRSTAESPHKHRQGAKRAREAWSAADCGGDSGRPPRRRRGRGGSGEGGELSLLDEQADEGETARLASIGLAAGAWTAWNPALAGDGFRASSAVGGRSGAS